VKTTLEKLKEARAILEAVPERDVGLDWFYRESECGTVACFAGWLAVKGFEGLRIRGDTPALPLKDGFLLGFPAMERVMGLSFGDTLFLFGPRTTRGDDELAALTDKQVALRRCDHLIRLYEPV